MRTLFVTVVFGLMLAASPAAGDRRDSLLVHLNHVVPQRIAALEHRWHIHYNPALRPGVRLGMPEDLDILNSWLLSGLYRSDSMLVYLAPPTGQEPWPETRLLDHELIHAYCDQVSRRLGRGPWPNFPVVDRYTKAQAAALRMQNEGIAEAATESRENLPGSKWQACLPAKPEECFVPGVISMMYTYQGGRALVQPIIDHVSLDSAVVYILTHPVDTRGRNFHRDLVRWVEQAGRDLNLPPTDAQRHEP